MIEWYVRPAYQRWCVEPLTRWLYRWGFWTPQRLTFIAGLCGLLCAIFLFQNHCVGACVFLWLSGYFDSLDGSLARMSKSHSPRGAVIDIMSDRMVECLVMVGLFSIAPNVRGLPIVLMLVSTLLCITAFLVVGIFTHNDSEKSFHYSRGLMERPEAFVFYTAMILLPKAFFTLALVYSLLVLLTAALHIYRFICAEKIGGSP